VGVRYVHTDEDVVTYTAPAPTSPVRSRPRPSAHSSPHTPNHSYNDVLPSANLKIDVTQDLVARFRAAETMTRADYSALGGFTSLSPPGTLALPGQPQQHGGGTTGNPDLKPIRSTTWTPVSNGISPSTPCCRPRPSIWICATTSATAT